MKIKLALPLCLVLGFAAGCPKGPEVTVWDLDQAESIGRLAPEILGGPQAIEKDGRKAFCFDGKADGFLFSANPLQGWSQFTIQILFRPDTDGPPEQRFLHIQDDQERRVLIETRMTPQRDWSLDTFLRANDADKLTLLDLQKTQPADRWYWAALTYDGKTMRHYVNARLQMEGPVNFPPTGPGRISLGVRQNRVHWFKGCIAQVRFSPVAMEPRLLLQP